MEAEQKKVKEEKKIDCVDTSYAHNQLMNAIKPNLGMAKGPNETWS